MANQPKKSAAHKGIRQDGRPNGKSWKKHPKFFNAIKRRLAPARPNR